MKTLITLLLCLTIVSAKATEFYLVSTNPPPKPQFTICEGAMALVVLTFGAVVIYKICKANFWTNIPAPPQPPPAPPATNAPSTNNPATNNSTAGKHWWHWSFGGGAGLTKSASTLPIPLLSTNSSWINPDGLVFDYYVRVQAPIRSSRDLTNWQYCYVDSWANTNGTLCVLYDGQGLPLYTNYTTDDSTNVVEGIWCEEPQEFFKYEP